MNFLIMVVNVISDFILAKKLTLIGLASATLISSILGFYFSYRMKVDNNAEIY